MQNPPRSSASKSAFAFLLLLCSISLSVLAAEPDILVTDFEGSNWGDWKVTGEAFGSGPAHGTLPNQMPVEGFLGKGLVNSFVGGDASTGTLTSPPFKIERRYLRFLIGGGKNPGQTCINLLVDSQVVRTATGPNDKPGGSERLDWEQWDTSDFMGKMAVIEIVDRATGGWGHINIDHIIQTDQRLPGWVANPERRFTPVKPYLNLPIKNGAPRRTLSILMDGRLERQFEIELADDSPDWWAFMDLGPFKNKPVLLRLDKMKEDSQALANIEQGDDLKSVEPLYQERLRPQFHFSSRRGWNNDPNGLVYYAGEYHLFYQHNPYGWNWGNMHWGHAVSRDLVHWQELGDALFPDELGTIFSGSAIIDSENTSGLARGSHQPLICFYTAAGGTSPLSKGQPFSQCFAYSLDRGRTWTKYDKNPALPHIVGDNRDPKVIWYAPGKCWILALYLQGSTYGLFSSKDLKGWQKLSEITIPGTSECPEFFEIPVESNRSETRWIFYGGNGRYLIGRFDGATFVAESGPYSLNSGSCFYASQTFNQIPAKDGRRILMPWGTVATPGMPFNQMLGVPIQLTLRSCPDGLRLHVNPIRELEKLRQRSHNLKPRPLLSGDNPLSGVRGELLEILADISVGQATQIIFNVRGVALTCDLSRHELRCQDKKATLRLPGNKLSLHLLVDRTSIDIFGDDGLLYMPMGVLLSPENTSLQLTATGSGARVDSLRVYELQSAWKR